MELVTKEMLELNVVPEEIFEKIEEYKTAIQWWETFRYELQKAMKENNITKFEVDDYIFNLVGENQQKRVNTEVLKKTEVYVPNSETGELEPVNAYDLFSKSVTVKEHLSIREKK